MASSYSHSEIENGESFILAFVTHYSLVSCLNYLLQRAENVIQEVADVGSKPNTKTYHIHEGWVRVSLSELR